jgi:hypothetical protein
MVPITSAMSRDTTPTCSEKRAPYMTPRQHIASERIGAERMRDIGRTQRVVHVDGVRVITRDQRRKQPREHDDEHQRESDASGGLRKEPAPEGRPRALHGQDLLDGRDRGLVHPEPPEPSLTRGSTRAYKRSTTRFTAMNAAAMNSTAP